ncbi:hypothetical protein HNV11_17180 [Spirosoma taeanense]|uniref:Endonuclease/exonuclease/phosphatase domain-containing protein n=1 Tax=Spirosoma taeanense TaxID=2735870 RepID=A0A6M5YCG9_9BACT|nr:endonuclease/exonuclease/phosphatase family protein [Spirosoma taeanense]QJW90983.1 hypothetical protein HNV11_17180 [Spirosoma taeanense]
MSKFYQRFYNRLFVMLCCGLSLAMPVLAQVSVTPSSTTLTETFNTLVTSGTATYEQNTTIPGVYAERTGTGTTITASNGGSNAGALYSFGTGTETDRALGSVGSGGAAAGSFAYGIRLQNNTGFTITSLQVTYAGEQWRNSGAAAQTVTFSYLVSASPITSLSVAAGAVPTGYTAVPSLDFTSPISGTTVASGALNGNAADNRTVKTYTITGLSVANGQEVMLRWYDADQTGSDHGLSIDDVSIVPTTDAPSTNPTLTATPVTISNLMTNVGTTSAPGSYTLTGRNLTQPVNISATAGVEISNDGSIYTPTLSITPASGNVDAVIRVRLTGATAGPVSATVSNATSTTAGPLSVNVTVSGAVNDPAAPFATIAVARAQPNGTSTASLPGGKVAGRVTVSSQFGGKQFYIQDATAGISVFNSTTAVGSQVQLGDSIQVAGVINTYQGARELDITSYTVVAGTPRIPEPKVVTLDQLPANEGLLVKVLGVTISGTAPTFSSTSYTLTAGSSTGTLYIKGASELNGATKPSGPVDIVGISDHFTSGATNITELFPRILSDVPGATLADQICGGTGGSELTRDQTFDISTWNVEFFGADAGSITCPTAPTTRPYADQGPVDEDKQARNVKAVFEKLNADIIVDEEVSDEARYAQVVSSLPGSYSYVCSNRFSYYFQNECDQTVNSDGTVFGPTRYAQKVCVLYNTATVTPVLAESKPLLMDKYSYPSSNGWASGRLPYLFVANVTINGVTRKIHVVGIHAKSGSATADYNRRKQDILDLKAELDQNYPNANIILLGDYNDQILTSITSGQPSTYAAFDQDAANYQVITKPLEATGCVTFNSSASFIDHITISNELAPAYVGNSTNVLLPATGIEGPYGATTSDHNPVSARFNLAALPGDSSPLAVTLTANPTQVTSAGSTTLSATVSGGTAPYSYTFSGPGTITPNGNTATVTNLTATGAQSFTVKVSDAASQTATAITSVTVTGGSAGTGENLFVGTGAGASNTSGGSNVALGPKALFSNQTGTNNVAVGDSAGYKNLASWNTFIGSKAGYSNTTGVQATFVGDSAGYFSNGRANTFIGYRAGLRTTTGSFNTFMGVQAGLNNTTGSSNFIMGTNAGVSNTTGTANFFLGDNAGGQNVSGGFNVYLGTNAGNGVGVNGDNNVAIGFESGKTNTGGITNTFVGFRADAGASGLQNAAAIGANARVTTSNALVLGSNVNVGIGTTAPTAKLEVVSSTTNSSGLKLTQLTSASPASLNVSKFLTVDATGNVILANFASGSREAAIDGLWKLNGQYLQNTGTGVVIGDKISKTPVGYRLFVQDGILTEKVKVAIRNTSEWADYVFANGYRLKPLAEVEAFVKTHRHLPGVPSAAEVVKDGVDVGKMDAKLLEKVEETMLYLMQMNKRLEQLEKENQQLKKENQQIRQQLKNRH